MTHVEPITMQSDAWRYHAATGCPLARATSLLKEMPPELRGRVLLAITLPRSGRFLTDPIEADPVFSAQFQAARNKAEATVVASGLVGTRGSCHALWAAQKRILFEEHGITWFSPDQMNPDVVFD